MYAFYCCSDRTLGSGLKAGPHAIPYGMGQPMLSGVNMSQIHAYASLLQFTHNAIPLRSAMLDLGSCSINLDHKVKGFRREDWQHTQSQAWQPGGRQ